MIFNYEEEEKYLIKIEYNKQLYSSDIIAYRCPSCHRRLNPDVDDGNITHGDTLILQCSEYHYEQMINKKSNLCKRTISYNNSPYMIQYELNVIEIVSLTRFSSTTKTYLESDEYWTSKIKKLLPLK